MRVESTAVSSTKCGYKEISCLQVNGFTASSGSELAQKMEKKIKQTNKYQVTARFQLAFNSCWKDSDVERNISAHFCDWFQQTAFKTQSKEKFLLPFVVGIFFKADIREESPCRVKAISAVRYLSKVDVCTKVELWGLSVNIRWDFIVREEGRRARYHTEFTKNVDFDVLDTAETASGETFILCLEGQKRQRGRNVAKRLTLAWDTGH